MQNERARVKNALLHKLGFVQLRYFYTPWSHLGHIVSADRDDKHDIVNTNRRNILCGQINNVLCCFGKYQFVV